MSFSSLPQQPPTGLNSEVARVEQRQLNELAARGSRTQPARASTPESLHRMVARVRAAMRAHRSSR